MRARLERLSADLAEVGVRWRQPQDTRVPPMRKHVSAFPYSWLQYLCRILMLVDTGQPVTPVTGVEGLSQHDLNELYDQATLLYSHLLCHSSIDGFYVPVDVDEPLFLQRGDKVEVVGSSHGLLAELRRCAPALGIGLEDDGSLSDAEASRLDEDVAERRGAFTTETTVWLTLFEACRVSIAGGHAIVFY